MPSFVSNLRMRNMFPINSDLGNARIDDSGNELNQILSAAKRIAALNQRQRPGVERITNNPEPEPQGLRFGGMTPPSNNDFHRAESLAIYENMKKPMIIPGSEAYGGGAAADQQYAEDYFRRKNEETRSQATLEAAGNKGWQVVNTTDPNDPTQQRSFRVNPNTGEYEEIGLPGVVTNKDTPNNIQKRIDNDNAKMQNRKIIENNVNDMLNVLNAISKQRIDSTGKPVMDEEGIPYEDLNTNVQNITGFSGNLPPWLLDVYPPNATARADIGRLHSMLALDKIQQMRGMTKTGGSPFGSNVNAKEFQTLMSAATKLGTLNQSEPGFAKELARIRQALGNILQQNASDEPDTGGMEMATSHDTTQPDSMNTGKIRVRNKVTGQTGSISPQFFNPQKYDRIQ